MKVVNFTLARDNPYSRMMYCALGTEFEPHRGTAEDALNLQRSGESQLFHINWEELLIRDCPTEAEALLLCEHFLRQVKEFRSLGGKVVWTVHNELPHELQFVSVFLRMRRELAGVADKIIVHSKHALTVLKEQAAFDPDRAVVLPHPSYLGEYEPVPDETPQWRRPEQRVVLAFGKVRPYKGYSSLLEAVSNSEPSSFCLRIVGEPQASDPYGECIQSKYEAHPRIEFDYRHVPPDEVASLVRSARALILPYERFLTSGVALLGMTLGVPIVAPDTPQMREVLPPANHPLLYDAGKPSDQIRAIEQALELSDAEVLEIRKSDFERASELSPQRISQKLGDIFRSL